MSAEEVPRVDFCQVGQNKVQGHSTQRLWHDWWHHYGQR